MTAAAPLRREVVAGTALLRRAGDAACLPLILLHGIGSNAGSWTPLIEMLDPRLPVIAWDAPGYGASVPVEPPAPTPAAYADRLAAVLDALGLRRVLLAGHSLGALFAASFAASRPERVAALALFSPALGHGVPPGQPLPPAVRARIEDLEQLGPAEFAARRSARLVHRPEEKPVVLESVRRAMASVHPAGYAQAVRALGAGDLLADAARIAAPALVAVGAEDVVTPPANAQAVFAALPRGLRLEQIPACGHALPQEAPGLAAALLARLAMATLETP